MRDRASLAIALSVVPQPHEFLAQCGVIVSTAVGRAEEPERAAEYALAERDKGRSMTAIAEELRGRPEKRERSRICPECGFSGPLREFGIEEDDWLPPAPDGRGDAAITVEAREWRWFWANARELLAAHAGRDLGDAVHVLLGVESVYEVIDAGGSLPGAIRVLWEAARLMEDGASLSSAAATLAAREEFPWYGTDAHQ
jgi:hypothetical protein